MTDFQGHLHKNIKSYLVLTAALSMAGGGGAGTWAATAQVEERVRGVETTQAGIKKDVEHIKKQVEEVKEELNKQGEASEKASRKLDLILYRLDEDDER